MQTLHALCLEALRWPTGATLQTLALHPVSIELVRTRAPKQVTRPDTLDFRTLTPERGGLFDYKVFGPGTVIDAPPLPDDEPVKPRNTTFGRIVLASPIPHPLFPADAIAANAELVLTELPVLPPDLRPLTRLDDDRWQSSPINDLYRRVIERNHRLERLAEVAAPADVIANERAELSRALLALFDNEAQAVPVADREGRPLTSLRSMCGPTDQLVDGLQSLDMRARSTGPLPGRLYRLSAVMFAMGFELRAA